MDQELLEEVLSCPTLPSLPAVAVEVIEQTRDPEVKLEHLAKTIENDQGLASKVLRTVNSSYYGLRQKCATIRQALVVLGLSAVKSLALGFSLVSSVDRSDDAFDFDEYWRRGLFTAVAARSITRAAGCAHEDEAFLAGLLQDIGMAALHASLGSRYTALIDQTGGDHRKLCRFEIAELELQHPDLGAMMAQRWKLPEELVLPVKYHERPSAGPVGAIGDLVRAVGLGGILAEALLATEPLPAMRRFRSKAKDWFNLGNEQVDEIVAEVTTGTKEMASLFDIDAGEIPDAEQLVAQARDQAVEIAIEAPPVPSDDSGMDALLIDSPRYDSVTGLVNDQAFASLYSSMFDAVVKDAEPLSVVRLILKREGENASAKTADVNRLVVGAATLLRKHFEHAGAVIARTGPMSFIVASTVNRSVATRTAEAFRQEFSGASESWGTPASVTLGVATRDAETVEVFDRPTVLQAAAVQALKAAAASGGGCVKFFTPRRAA
ncbi:MAG: HDOD domain-containing protein [Planctomycetota bacterium]